jgi:putative transposase
MQQMARNVTEADTGFLSGCRYLLRGRDTKFGAAFDGVLGSVGIKPTVLPPRSPNLNAHCERWIRSVKTEVLLNMTLSGERSLRHCLAQYLSYYHEERNHQGKNNVVLFPLPADRIGEPTGEIRMRERLGGLLKFCDREAA